MRETAHGLKDDIIFLFVFNHFFLAFTYIYSVRTDAYGVCDVFLATIVSPLVFVLPKAAVLQSAVGL